MIDPDRLKAFADHLENGPRPRVRVEPERHVPIVDRNAEEGARRVYLQGVLSANRVDRERERALTDVMLRGIAEALDVDVNRLLADDFCRVEARGLAHMIASRHR
jgi:hypothetical protein